MLGDPYSIAAEILSYAPEEQLPRRLAGLIDAHLAASSRHGAGVDGFVYARAAGVVKLVLGEPDARALRERMWDVARMTAKKSTTSA